MVINLNITILFFVFLLSSFSSYSTCHDINLKESPVLGTVRNQGSLGWCYAYTMADLVSMALKKRVSAFDIAINLYRYRDSNRTLATRRIKLTSLVGGSATDVMQANEIFGVCEDRKFSSYVENNTGRLLKIDEMANRFMNYSGSDRKEKIRKEVYSAFTSIYNVFPMTPANKLADAFINSNQYDFPLGALSDEICHGERLDTSGLELIMSSGLQGKLSNLDFINEGLRLKKPIGVAYNARILKERGQFQGVTHMSSIIGSRNLNGKCQYLLRNSWGQFNSVHHSPDLTKQRSGDYIWLDQDFVKDMAIQKYRLKGKGY